MTKISQTIKIGIFIITIYSLSTVSLPSNSYAQELINPPKKKSFSFTENPISDIEIQPHMFDRLKVKLYSHNSLFDNNRVILNLKNYFKNEVVYYSINSRAIYETSVNNYSDNTREKVNNENKSDNTPHFDLSEYEADFTLDPSYSFYIDFINNVERNQFFYDMYAKHNDIYTNEFSILDFQSAQADQYINGSKVWGGAFVGMFGVLMLMPRSVTKWEEGYIDDAISNLNRAFSEPPVWDEDHWEINYIGHPYAGSLYYNTIRSQGGSMLSSFLFSAFISTGWEYVYEGVAEQPSIQDLFVTPVAGAVLGEIIHQATLGMKKNGYSIFEAAFVTIFNPMHVIINGYQ